MSDIASTVSSIETNSAGDDSQYEYVGSSTADDEMEQEPDVEDQDGNEDDEDAGGDEDRNDDQGGDEDEDIYEPEDVVLHGEYKPEEMRRRARKANISTDQKKRLGESPN
jgi:hypothetical protein